MVSNQHGLSRFEDLLNNPCEQYNASLLEIRGLPILRMVKGILQDIYRKVFLLKSTSVNLQDHQRIFTDWAEKRLEMDRQQSRKFTVLLREATNTVLKSDVMIVGDSLVIYKCEMRQDASGGQPMMICSCCKMWDTGRPCKHLVATF